jgi:hypothetical protein
MVVGVEVFWVIRLDVSANRIGIAAIFHKRSQLLVGPIMC